MVIEQCKNDSIYNVTFGRYYQTIKYALPKAKRKYLKGKEDALREMYDKEYPAEKAFEVIKQLL